MRGEWVDWFEVVSKVESGDPAALLRLTGLVASLMQKLGAYKADESHEDLIQDITLSLIRSVRGEAIEDRRRFVAYAYAVTRNRLINAANARVRRGRQAVGVDPDELCQGGSHSVHASVEHASDPQIRVDLERALAALPEDERRVIEAIYIRGLSYAEVCEELGLPLGTVKRRQWRGLRALRARMGLTGKIS